MAQFHHLHVSANWKPPTPLWLFPLLVLLSRALDPVHNHIVVPSVCFPLKSSRPTCNAIFYHMPFEEGHPIFFFFLNPSSLHSYCSSLPECSGDFVPGPPSTPAGSSLDHAPATEPAHWPFASHHDAACHGAIVPFL